MILETLTGVTEKRNIRVVKPIEHLVIKATGTGRSDILDAEIRVDYYQGGKDKAIYPGTPLKIAAAFAGQLFGIGKYENADGVYLIIPVAYEGGLKLVGGDYLDVTLSGLNSDSTIVLMGQESFDTKGYPIKCHRLELHADQTKMKFSNVELGLEELVLTKANLTLLKMYSADGTPDFVWDELLAHNMIENEVAAAGVMTDHMLADNIVFNVDGINEFEIEKPKGSSYTVWGFDYQDN